MFLFLKMSFKIKREKLLNVYHWKNVKHEF